jgi:hypothetical protein
MLDLDDDFVFSMYETEKEWEENSYCLPAFFPGDEWADDLDDDETSPYFDSADNGFFDSTKRNFLQMFSKYDEEEDDIDEDNNEDQIHAVNQAHAMNQAHAEHYCFPEDYRPDSRAADCLKGPVVLPCLDHRDSLWIRSSIVNAFCRGLDRDRTKEMHPAL